MIDGGGLPQRAGRGGTDQPRRERDRPGMIPSGAFAGVGSLADGLAAFRFLGIPVGRGRLAELVDQAVGFGLENVDEGIAIGALA